MGPLVEADHAHFLQRRIVLQRLVDFRQGDPARPFDRKAIRARADRRESNGVDAVLFRQGKTFAVATGEKLVFAVVPAVPDRADGVDDPFRGQIITLGDFRLAGFAAVERAALFQQLRPGGAMDGAVHAAAAQERSVGGVDDGIDVLLGDVALEDCETRVHVTPE